MIDFIKTIKHLNSKALKDKLKEYKQTKERYDFMCEQRLDLEDSSSKLKKVIQDMTKIMKEQFEKQFKVINRNLFKTLLAIGVVYIYRCLVSCIDNYTIFDFFVKNNLTLS